MLAFCNKMMYSIACRRDRDVFLSASVWSVGQAAKTSPSHGENRGSIPLQTALMKISPTRKKLVSHLWLTGFLYIIKSFEQNSKYLESLERDWLLKSPDIKILNQPGSCRNQKPAGKPPLLWHRVCIIKCLFNI